MQILAYGEDALTLWALKNKLADMLQMVNDTSDLSRCRAFFRPSFGRSGGAKSPQFGEFDFILLANSCLYLGESKWDKSSEKIRDGVLSLRNEQLLRHEMLRFYVEEWAFGNCAGWGEFEKQANIKLMQRGITKPVAPENSLLAANLQAVLATIKHHYTELPVIKNMLLFLYNAPDKPRLPKAAGKDFLVVPIDYSQDQAQRFIEIGM